jgi:translation initiation factor 3 subunit D
MTDFAADAAKIFASADKNGDGTLTKSEIKKYAQTPAGSSIKTLFDVKNSGWGKLWETVDQDGDGSFSLEEFTAAYVAAIEADPENCKTIPAVKGFRLPTIQYNATGWGPVAGVSEEKFQNIPYAPFGKGDRLGRAADWSGSSRPSRYYGGKSDVSGAFGYTHDGQDETFQLVDTRPAPRPQHFGPRRHFPNNPRRDSRGKGGDKNNQLNAGAQRSVQRELDQAKRRNQKRFGKNDTRWDQNRVQQRLREASVDVQADWRVLEQINLPVLSKLKYNAPEGEDLTIAGMLYPYDRSAERCSTKKGKKLERMEQTSFYYVTASDDPMIEQLAADTDAQIFATDQVLAVLMTAPRSIYSWDVVVTKKDGKIFFDKRDGSSIDYLTVNETANETPAGDAGINSAASLAQEATCINQNISQQLLMRGESPKTFDLPNPFASEEETPAAVAYRYRRFDLAEGYNFIVRTEVDGVSNEKGADKFVNVRALNEFDARLSSWGTKLDVQKGAVLAAELKNNSAKLARWTAMSMLADVELIKLGFVSRQHPRDPYNHMILNMQSFRPSEMLQQTNLDMNNCWGIVKGFVDIIRKQDDGQFVILKDPNKPLLRIYEVPLNAFQTAEE